MSDYSVYPNRVSADGEVAVTGQRLRRIEDALFNMRSSTLNIRYSDIISIEQRNTSGTVDLTKLPFYVEYSSSGQSWTVGSNRANIPAMYILGFATEVDDSPDRYNQLTITADGTSHLISYALTLWQGGTIYANLQATAIADIETLQTQNAVVWPLAWVKQEEDAQPVILAQIEQGYCLHIPAVTMGAYPIA
jgi:hypothetical protein